MDRRQFQSAAAVFGLLTLASMRHAYALTLADMSNADAKRLVDFAAGLAFALRGSFDKVATKVFLLAPADIDVSPEDRRRIAETGFYSHS